MAKKGIAPKKNIIPGSKRKRPAPDIRVIKKIVNDALKKQKEMQEEDKKHPRRI